MFIFKNDPSTPVDVKSVFFRIVVAAICFSVIFFYLVPMIDQKPLHEILKAGTILVAIFFLLDLIF